MEHREIQLLENDMLLAAIYVDSNNKIMLSEDQITRGKVVLLGLSEKITKEKEADYMASPQIDTSPATSSSEFDEDDIEKQLDYQEKMKRHTEAQAGNVVDAALSANNYKQKFHFDFY